MPKKNGRKALILYYSNSGNTKNLALLAEKTLKSQGWTCLTSSLKDFESGSCPNPEMVVLGVPIHFWTIPTVPAGLIKNLPRFDGAGAFVYATFGNVFPSDVPLKLANFLEERGARVLGGAAMAAPHNFMTPGRIRLGDAYPEFGLGQPDEQDNEAFCQAVSRVAQSIEDGRLGGFDLRKLGSPKKVLTFMDRFVPTSVELKFLPPVWFDALLCTDCGKCLDGCDTNSISRTTGKGKAVNQKTCVKCYTCARECPAGALKVDWPKNEKMLRMVKKILPEPKPRIESV